MLSEIVEIFRENFPFVVRDERTVCDILGNKENVVIEKRDENDRLIGVSVVNKNSILLLCVNKECRKKGIGSELLKRSEEVIESQNYDYVKIGVGFDYLTPGVPTSKMIYEEKLMPDDIYKDVDDETVRFFKNRGYYHSWTDANCFDMKLELSQFNEGDLKIGDTLDGITYCFARVKDMDEIVKCTNDAEENFTKYYLNKNLYKENYHKRVLIAKDGNEVVGTIIVNLNAGENGLGSAGCTAVKHSHRKRHIASNLVLLATGYLKSMHLKSSFIGYTYSGLDRLYGYSGYKICVYYFMARKDLKK